MTEWKKIARPAAVIPVVMILIVLSVHLHGNMYSGEAGFRDARVKMYAYLAGQSDPLDWALTYRGEIDARLEEIQMQILFTENIDTERELRDELAGLSSREGMFADGIGADFLCLNAAIRNMQRIAGLERSWEEEISSIRHAAKRLGDPALLRESQYLEQAYGKLRIPEYGNYEPFDDWIRWNGSYGWIVLMAVAYIVSFVFSSERKNGMHTLLLAVAIHPRRIACRKAVCSMVSAFLIVTLLFAPGLGIALYMTGDLWALSQPVQAITSMQYSCLPLSVGEMLLVQYGLYMAAAVLVAGLTLLFSMLLKEAWIVFALSAGVVIMPDLIGYVLRCPQKYLLSGMLGAAEWLRLTPRYVIVFAVCAVITGIFLTVQACRSFGGMRNVAA